MHLWNSWKSTLLDTLYHATCAYLQSTATQNQQQLIHDKQQQAAIKLTRQDLDDADIQALWQRLPNTYFRYFDANTLAWQTQVILNQQDDLEPAIACRTHPTHGHAELMLFIHNPQMAFAKTTNVLDALNLNIAEARFYRNSQNEILCYFILLNHQNQRFNETSRLKEVVDVLTIRLHSTQSTHQKHIRRSSAEQHFEMAPEISFSEANLAHARQIDITCIDRPGLLADIAAVFAETKLGVHHAKVTTLGEKVNDSFILSRSENHLFSAAFQDTLSQALQEIL